MKTVIGLISVVALLALVLAGPGAVDAGTRKHLGDQAISRMAQSTLMRTASHSIGVAQDWFGSEWLTKPLAPAIRQALAVARADSLGDDVRP